VSTPATEPVRRNVYVAAAFIIISSFFAALGLAADITFQVVAAALGVAFAQGGAAYIGVERARANVYPAAVVEGDHEAS
jgi:hypothetical protein